MTAVLTKTCARCGEVKPIAEMARDAARASGLHPYCKRCDAAIVAAIGRRHSIRTEEEISQAQARLRPSGHKHCYGCRQDLPLDSFNRNRWAADGLQSRCSACQKEAGAQWRKKRAAARARKDRQS